ncbi:Hypothetical protein D9617_9g024370 [Elsinoe fawcettii]|nr:Hypothetical protein D9617_9g024370 [Elsinoe fawcettii]
MELNSRFSFENWTIKYHLSPVGANPGTKTVVFVHGTPWSSVVFQPIAKALLARNGYRVLLYDLPGYGQSQQLDSVAGQSQDQHGFRGDTSVALQSRALTALLKHLSLDGSETGNAPSIIAHDIAGTIALRAHLIHGCQYKSLLLLDTNTVLPWGDGFYKLARSEPQTFLKLPPRIFEAVIRSVIQSACFNVNKLSGGWEDELAEPWTASPTSGPEEIQQRQSSFMRQIAQANDADVAEMLDDNMYERVACPVKIMWGEQDQWIPREKMDQLATILGSQLKEFVVVPEAGHLLMIDQPEGVALEIFSWLERA